MHPTYLDKIEKPAVIKPVQTSKSLDVFPKALLTEGYTLTFKQGHHSLCLARIVELSQVLYLSSRSHMYPLSIDVWYVGGATDAILDLQTPSNP